MGAKTNDALYGLMRDARRRALDAVLTKDCRDLVNEMDSSGFTVLARAGRFCLAVAQALYPALFWTGSRLDDAHPVQRPDGVALRVVVDFGDEHGARKTVREMLRALLRAPGMERFETVELEALRSGNGREV